MLHEKNRPWGLFQQPLKENLVTGVSLAFNDAGFEISNDADISGTDTADARMVNPYVSLSVKDDLSIWAGIVYGGDETRLEIRWRR